MKIEIELDPDEFRTIKAYAAVQGMTPEEFALAVIRRAIRPNEESE